MWKKAQEIESSFLSRRRARDEEEELTQPSFGDSEFEGYGGSSVDCRMVLPVRVSFSWQMRSNGPGTEVRPLFGPGFGPDLLFLSAVLHGPTAASRTRRGPLDLSRMLRSTGRVRDAAVGPFSIFLFFSRSPWPGKAMDVISFKSPTFAVQGSFPARWHLMCGLSERIPVLSLNRKANMQTLHSRFIPCAKGFPFQDFQGFAKPLRLLPAEEVNICAEPLLEGTLTFFVEDQSCSLYIVQLQTSGDFGSTLSDLNAAILLCMIDVNGDSILQRMPMTTLEHTRDLEETADSDMLRFQRGSIDKVAFKGPKLKEIEALWIGLESGCWRLGVVSLTVIHQSSLKSTEYGNQNKYSGQHYQFDASDILLGDSGGVSMVELRPILVREVDRVDLLTLFNMGVSQSASATNNKISNDESMKEYADLKLSLLLYDAILIFIGTSIAAVFIDKNAAYAFLIGGGSGFIYLLLLQKSVDGLPTPSLPVTGNKKDDLTQVFGGFKGPLSSVSLALILSVIAVKYGFSSASVVLTPQELLVGVAGFLTCKIAVILAAFKPMQASKKEDK